MPTNEEEDREALKLLLRSLGFVVINVGRAIKAHELTNDLIVDITTSFDELADRTHEFYKPY